MSQIDYASLRGLEISPAGVYMRTHGPGALEQAMISLGIHPRNVMIFALDVMYLVKAGFDPGELLLVRDERGPDYAYVTVDLPAKEQAKDD